MGFGQICVSPYTPTRFFGEFRRRPSRRVEHRERRAGQHRVPVCGAWRGDMAVTWDCGACPQDEWLISPVVDCSGKATVKLSYWHLYDDWDTAIPQPSMCQQREGRGQPANYTADDNGTLYWTFSARRQSTQRQDRLPVCWRHGWF